MKKQTLVNTHKYSDIRTAIVKLVETGRAATARAINAVLTATYWEIGKRIVEFEQAGKQRAEYGSKLIEKLSTDLTSRLGRGFSVDNLELMRSFYIAYPPAMISESMIRKLGSKNPRFKKSESPIRTFTINDLQEIFSLSWTHYVRLVRNCESLAERKFYEEEALRGGWSVRALERQINTKFYQRTLLSNKKAALLKKSNKKQTGDTLTPEEVIKDPYILEFLDLKDEYSESDLEASIIYKLEKFLLELGDDFAFIGRQRRLRIGSEWYRVDLLFFHRRLRSLVLIDLKLGRFTHADSGQMHLYLNYAKENWMQKNENPPVGLILCAQKEKAVAHYALEGLPNKIMAAEYKLVLPNETKLANELSKVRKTLQVSFD